MSLVNGKWRTSTVHSSEISRLIVLKLKLKKHVQGANQHAKYGADQKKCVGGAYTQFGTVFGSTLCFFLYSSHRVLATPLDRFRRAMAHSTFFSAKEVPFGGLDDEK